MNEKQVEIMKSGKGFIAALDQSGGSTPKALSAYGIPADAYESEERMFELVHEMRSRIIKSPSFTHEKILGAILFERTMDGTVENRYTADFLWEVKGIVPFLKIDKGLASVEKGVQLMKPIPGLESTLSRALDRNIFGTKMRSVIKEYNPAGITQIVDQQFELAAQISARGLVPIIEPEVDIRCPEKEKCEELLLDRLLDGLDRMDGKKPVMFKLTIPTVHNLYKQLIDDERVLRTVALSGGYSREEADERLSLNRGLIASFSRALTEGLTVQQSAEEFDALLRKSIESIYQASVT